jgi:hypothetical protein
MGCGVGPLVCSCLEAMAGDPDVQAAGMHSLTALAAESSRNRELLGGLGAPEVVVRALRDHGQDEEVQCWGCYAMDKLATRNAANRASFGRIGGPALLIKNAWRFEASPQSQSWLLRAVGNLASDAHSSALLVAEGACATVVTGMTRFDREVEVCHWGAFAVAVLASRNGDSVDPLLEAGACNALANALASMGESVEVSQRCTDVPSSSMPTDDAPRRLGPPYKSCASITALKTNYIIRLNGFLNLQVVRWACYGAAHLALKSPTQVRKAFMETATAPVILRLLKQHATHPDVQTCGLRALGAMGGGGVKVGLAPLCDAVLGPMVTMPRDPDVMAAACYAIAELSSDTAACQALGKAGGCQQVVQALEACAAEPKLRAEAEQAAAALSKDTTNRAKIQLALTASSRGHAKVSSHAAPGE